MSAYSFIARLYVLCAIGPWAWISSCQWVRASVRAAAIRARGLTTRVSGAGTNAAYIFSIINIIVAATAVVPSPDAAMPGMVMNTTMPAPMEASGGPMSAFEVAALLITFVLMGKWLEVRACVVVCACVLACVRTCACVRAHPTCKGQC